MHVHCNQYLCGHLTFSKHKFKNPMNTIYLSQPTRNVKISKLFSHLSKVATVLRVNLRERVQERKEREGKKFPQKHDRLYSWPL